MDQKFMMLSIMLSIIFIVSGIITITILILDHQHTLKEYELQQLELKTKLKTIKSKRSGEDNVE